MKISSKFKLRVLLVLGTLAPGPIIYHSYMFLFKPDGGIGINIGDSQTNISILVSTFSFTMLGVLSAIITLVFAVSDKRVFLKYKAKGHFSTFLMFYGYTLFFLAVTFVLSIATFGKNLPLYVFDLMLISLTNNLVQTGLVSLVILRLVYKSTVDPHNE